MVSEQVHILIPPSPYALVSAQVYILGRMGNARQALHLIIEKLGDIPQVGVVVGRRGGGEGEERGRRGGGGRARPARWLTGIVPSLS